MKKFSILIAVVFCTFLMINPITAPTALAIGGGTCDGDIDGDGQVGLSDLLIVLTSWGACLDDADCPGDITGDSYVDFMDLLIVLENFGPCDGGGCESHGDCDDGNDCTFDFCIQGLCFNIPIWGCE